MTTKDSGSAFEFPPRVIDTLLQAAGVSAYHPDGDQLDKLHTFAWNVVAETIARFPGCAAASDQATVQAVTTDPEHCDAWCPRCQGSGEENVMSDNGPDAYEQTINCQHCDGRGTLYHAYFGVERSLEESRKAHLEACGKLWAINATPPQDGSQIRDAALEEAAKVCDERSEAYWNAYKKSPIDDVNRANPHVEGMSDGAENCANAIRALSKDKTT
ncbi:hypothetical protein OKW43_000022 [Paraburkholderia sp. WC7.3g]|uniref:hypothetical protein n=1 Tax=Paraburkholderia sp. WC7.3g TaxID=2991070 RepID=UPI003D22C129